MLTTTPHLDLHAPHTLPNYLHGEASCQEGNQSLSNQQIPFPSFISLYYGHTGQHT